VWFSRHRTVVKAPFGMPRRANALAAAQAQATEESAALEVRASGISTATESAARRIC